MKNYKLLFIQHKKGTTERKITFFCCVRLFGCMKENYLALLFVHFWGCKRMNKWFCVLSISCILVSHVPWKLLQLIWLFVYNGTQTNICHTPGWHDKLKLLSKINLIGSAIFFFCVFRIPRPETSLIFNSFNPILLWKTYIYT